MNARPDEKSFKDATPVKDREGEDRQTAAPATGAASAEGARMETAPAAEAPPKKKRRPIRKLLIVALPLVLAVGGGYYWVTGGRYINTEDAYVKQDRVTVMPQVSGQIASVNVAENQLVNAGDVLFTIDDAVYRNAVEQDQANLEAARLDVAKLKAAYQQAISQEQTARDALANAQTQDDRQSALVSKGYISQSSADATNLTLQQAKGALASAQSEVLGAKAALAGNPDIETDKHPEVLKALADLHAAELDLAHTKVYAPEAGVVSQTDRLQEGQYVTPSMSVMSVVETGNTWVEANYKETELTNMTVGQTVDVTLDTYPDHPIQATVGSIGAGTGSEFALLPAQNATGNWVKVVQRIPVRIHLEEGAGMPALRAGMSASVTVDTGKSRGVPDFLQPVVTALGLDPYLPNDGSTAVASVQSDLNAKPLAQPETLPEVVTAKEDAALAKAPKSVVDTSSDSGGTTGSGQADAGTDGTATAAAATATN